MVRCTAAGLEIPGPLDDYRARNPTFTPAPDLCCDWGLGAAFGPGRCALIACVERILQHKTARYLWYLGQHYSTKVGTVTPPLGTSTSSPVWIVAEICPKMCCKIPEPLRMLMLTTYG